MDDDFLMDDEIRELHIKKLIEDKEKQHSQFLEDVPDDLWLDDVYCEMMDDREIADDYDMPDDYESSQDDDDDIESLYVELFGEEENQDDDEDEDLFFYEIYGSYIPPNHHYF